MRLWSDIQPGHGNLASPLAITIHYSQCPGAAVAIAAGKLIGVERRLQADLTVVREEVKSVENTIIQQGKVLLDAIEINGQEQIKTDQRVDRIEKHLNLPPGK